MPEALTVKPLTGSRFSPFGDVIEFEVEGIGILRNRLVARS